MRVMQITGSFPPMRCGIGDYTARLASALSTEQGLTLAVITDERAAPIPCDIKYEVFPVARGWGLTDIPRLARAVYAWHPSVVHLQYPGQGFGSSVLPWVLPMLFAGMRFPVVLTWHEFWMGRFRFLPNALILSGLVLIRPGHIDQMPRHLRKLLKNKRIKEIPNATVLPSVRLQEDERRAIQSRYAPPGKKLVVYFGFAYPAKGVEQLFGVADPTRDHLLLLCDLNPEDPYHRRIIEHLGDPRWQTSASNPGFLPSEAAARVLAAADAVVLPFRDGGGKWSTSLHAALEQGTFVLTTSTDSQGYISEENCYFARPGDITEMQEALASYIGARNPSPRDVGAEMWKTIAEAHGALYRDIVSTKGSEYAS